MIPRPSSIVTLTDGTPCRVSLIVTGAPYGLNGCLKARDPLIEFEPQYKGTFYGRGWTYHLRTALGKDGYSRGSFFSGRGICLHGGSTYDPRVEMDGANLSRAMTEIFEAIATTLREG